MPPSKSVSKTSTSLALICGEDEFAVKQRAKQVYTEWTQDLGGMDHEIIDASAANSGEALKALAKLREALQTLPFFGSGKERQSLQRFSQFRQRLQCLAAIGGTRINDFMIHPAQILCPLRVDLFRALLDGKF